MVAVLLASTAVLGGVASTARASDSFASMTFPQDYHGVGEVQALAYYYIKDATTDRVALAACAIQQSSEFKATDALSEVINGLHGDRLVEYLKDARTGLKVLSKLPGKRADEYKKLNEVISVVLPLLQKEQAITTIKEIAKSANVSPLKVAFGIATNIGQNFSDVTKPCDVIRQRLRAGVSLLLAGLASDFVDGSVQTSTDYYVKDRKLFHDNTCLENTYVKLSLPKNVTTATLQQAATKAREALKTYSGNGKLNGLTGVERAKTHEKLLAEAQKATAALKQVQTVLDIVAHGNVASSIVFNPNGAQCHDLGEYDVYDNAYNSGGPNLPPAFLQAQTCAEPVPLGPSVSLRLRRSRGKLSTRGVTCAEGAGFVSRLACAAKSCVARGFHCSFGSDSKRDRLVLHCVGKPRVIRIEVPTPRTPKPPPTPPPSPGGVITTVVGGGSAGLAEGVPATSVKLKTVSSVAWLPGGQVAFGYGPQVWRVDPSGILHLIAGTATAGFSGDGGLATSAQLQSAAGLSTSPDGSILIADKGNRAIRRVSTTGVITTVAGGPGNPQPNGPAATLAGPVGPASQAFLFDASDVTAEPDGGFLLTEDHAVRRVRPDGIISTFAGPAYGPGNLQAATQGDGKPASQASFGSTTGVAVGPKGVYVVDQGVHRVRVIGSDGIIATLAGSSAGLNDGGFFGDGGPATLAKLSSPEDIAAAGDGSVYIADRFNERVRRVDPQGVITTVVGGGAKSATRGDGGPPLSAELQQPGDVAIDGANRLLVADNDNLFQNARVRLVSNGQRP